MDNIETERPIIGRRGLSQYFLDNALFPLSFYRTDINYWKEKQTQSRIILRKMIKISSYLFCFNMNEISISQNTFGMSIQIVCARVLKHVS